MRLFLKRLGLMLAVVAGGTAVDYVVHNSREEWFVEPEYYLGKLIFGVLWAIAGFYVLRYVLGLRTWRGMALGVPAIVAGVLQTKYFYQGRDLGFVMIFLFLHYLMFLPFSWLVFRRWSSVFGVGEFPVVNRLYWARFFSLVILVELVFAAYFISLYG